MSARECRLTEEAAPEIPTKGSTNSLTESALTFEDRQAAIAVSFQAGMHYQAGLDIEDRARAMLLDWSRASLSMARQYADRTGPAWSALVMDCAERDD